MTLPRTAYFMCIVGAMAGLLSWAVVTTFSFFVILDRVWTDLVAKILLGALAGALVVGFQDYWSGEPRLRHRVVIGLALGAVGGLVAGIIQIPIAAVIGNATAVANRIVAWILAGSLIGFALGLRWISTHPRRVALSFAGGFSGGALGGFVMSLPAGAAPDLATAFAYALISTGVACGDTLAGTVLRTGILEFVSSADASTQYKFTRNVNEWELRDGSSYQIRHYNPTPETSSPPPGEIWLPDGRVAERHARVFAKQNRFFVARHPSIRQLPDKYVLRVRGKPVAEVQELLDSDEIVIGRTTFRFSTASRHTGYR